MKKLLLIFSIIFALVMTGCTRVGGTWHNSTEDFAEGISVDGTTVINGSGQYVGAVNGTTGAFSGAVSGTSFTGTAGSFSGAFDTGNFIHGGGCLAIATTSGAYTLTAAQMLAYNCFEITSTASPAFTLTLPATSTTASLFSATGKSKSWIIENQHLAATTTTIAKGAGIDIVAVDTNADVIDGQEYAQIDCTRQTDMDVVCVVNELVHAD
jgi:hypothetical protein